MSHIFELLNSLKTLALVTESGSIHLLLVQEMSIELFSGASHEPGP